MRIKRLMQRWAKFSAAKVFHVIQTVTGWLIMAHWLACGWCVRPPAAPATRASRPAPCTSRRLQPAAICTGPAALSPAGA